MSKYTHLKIEDREKITRMHLLKESQAKIAMALGKSKSTISRELRRNRTKSNEYWPDIAQSKSKERRRRGMRLDRDSKLRAFVTEKLSCFGWTPEIISGHLKKKEEEEGIKPICYESIYQWIYSPSQRSEKWYVYLPRHKKKRGHRSRKTDLAPRIKDRISIHDRPFEIDKRETIGHWEGDLMSCFKNSQFMVVLRERKTMFTKSVRLSQKTAKETTRAIIDLLKDLPREALRSITFDNGGEFFLHTDIKEAFKGLQTYFCDPYSPWQKGGVENTNGRLRRDFPRKINLLKMSEEEFNESIDNYNSTPRKTLGWNTPLEMFRMMTTSLEEPTARNPLSAGMAAPPI